MTLISLGLLYLSINSFLADALNIPSAMFATKMLFPRRMGGQNRNFAQVPDCPGEICGVLFGKIPGSLLAGADPCAAQDLADEMIDAAKTKLKEAARAQLIETARAVAGAEKNSHPDYKNNSQPRNFLYCLKTPRNIEIADIVPTQDPANPPDLFVDPKTQKTIRLGEDPRTRPRTAQQNSGSSGNSTSTTEITEVEINDDDEDVVATITETKNGKESRKNVNTNDQDNKKSLNVNLNQVNTQNESGSSIDANGIKGGSGGDDPKNTKNNNNENGISDNNKNGISNNNDNGSGGNDGGNDGGRKGFQGIFIDPQTLGKCKNPQITFQSGFNGRSPSDLTFQPSDKVNYPQSEALNLAIVTNAMCDKMLNCGFKNEDETIKNCRKLGKLIGSSKGDGSGADKWNSAFGIITSFKDVKAPAKGGKKRM